MKRLLTGLALLAACSKSGTPPLYTEAEIAELTKRFAGPLPTPSCVRPVLRAAPTDRIDLELATRAVLPAECEPMKAEMISSPAPPTGPTDPELSLLEADRAAECLAKVRALVRSAVSHEAVCALPYETDAPTGELLGPFVLAKAGALDVLELAKTLPDEAMLVALDHIRFIHDLRRGHSTLVQAMGAVAMENLVLDRAALPLAQRQATWSNADVIARALAAIVATYPAMGEVLVGESAVMGRDHGLDVLAAPNVADETWGRSHDRGAAMLQTTASLREQWARACPPAASLHACRAGLQQLAAGRDYEDEGAREAARAKLLAAGWTAASRVATRDQLVAMDAESLVTSLTGYVEKLATPLVRLSVLRFQLAVTTRGACPTSDELRAAPWQELLAPIPLGDALRVEQSAQGFTLRAPDWVNRETQSWTVACAAAPP